MSEDIRAIGAAFLSAKKKFKCTGLSGKNSHQNYKYAKISDIYQAVEDALAENNIIIWHFAKREDGLLLLYTRLIHHLTGQFVEDCRILESEKPGNQAKSCANTFARKDAILSLCAIPTEEDDGEGEEKYIEKKNNEQCISEQQKKYLETEIASANNAEFLCQNIEKFNKIRDLKELKLSSFESVKSYIGNNRK